MPIDGEIQIAFDRYLLPASITRQSTAVLVTDANGTPVDAPIIRYDPVARTISIARPKADWLTVGQPYKLRLVIPPNDDVDDRGLRAIDRATLDPNQPLEFAFFAVAATGVPNEKTVTFCGDVLPIFTLKCGVCHFSGGGATSGLVLDSQAGIAATAIRRVANGANTSARGGDPDRVGRIFGANMPLIAPDEPDNSWLLYKVLLAREPTVDAGTTPPIVCNTEEGRDEIAPKTVDPVRFGVKVGQADEIERAILNDFVLGREMPYPVASVRSPGEQPLTFDERERIRLWIAQGAKMSNCGCAESVTPGGATADAASDAATEGGSDGGLDGGADAQDQ